LAPETNLIGFAPWDLDHSWGEFPLTGTLDQRIHASIHQPWIGDNFFVEKLFAISDFKERYLQEIQRQQTSIFLLKNLMRTLITSPVSFVHSFKRSLHPGPRSLTLPLRTEFVSQQDSGNPMDPNRPAHQIKRFINERRESVLAQLAGEEEGVVITFEQLMSFFACLGEGGRKENIYSSAALISRTE
jgi:hypothetical protein